MPNRQEAQHYRQARVPTIHLDDGRILAAEHMVETLAELGLDVLEGAESFSMGDLVRKAGYRSTYRVESSSGALYVKIHRGTSFFRAWNPFGSNTGSDARREWDAIRALRAADFDVPEPLALGESTSMFGAPRLSFLVTREVPGPTLNELLSGSWPDPRGLGQQAMRNRILKDVSGLIRRFHASGFYHKDLYCGHLIVAPDERWGRPYIIDLQRVERDFPPRRRWLVKDLAALLHSVPSAVTEADQTRFLLRYLCKTKVDPEVRRWARDIQKKREKIAGHVPRYP